MRQTKSQVCDRGTTWHAVDTASGQSTISILANLGPLSGKPSVGRSVAVGVSLFQYSPQDCALIALHCLALGERPTIASTNIHPTTTTPECEQPPAYSRVSPVLLHAIISYTRFDPTYAEGDLRGK